MYGLKNAEMQKNVVNKSRIYRKKEKKAPELKKFRCFLLYNFGVNGYSEFV